MLRNRHVFSAYHCSFFLSQHVFNMLTCWMNCMEIILKLRQPSSPRGELNVLSIHLNPRVEITPGRNFSSKQPPSLSSAFRELIGDVFPLHIHTYKNTHTKSHTLVFICYGTRLLRLPANIYLFFLVAFIKHIQYKKITPWWI